MISPPPHPLCPSTAVDPNNANKATVNMFEYATECQRTDESARRVGEEEVYSK
jgi:hypothetical protein